MTPALRRPAVLLSCLFALGIVSTTASAYTPACYKEVRQICSDVEPGEGRLTNCVVRSQSQFSVSCRPEVHAVIEQRGRFTSLCKENAKSLCPGIKPGKGRLYSCLKFNEQLLTSACKAQLQ